MLGGFCRAGSRSLLLADDVVITAVVAQRWQSCIEGVRCDVELILVAINLTLDSSKRAAVKVRPSRPQTETTCQAGGGRIRRSVADSCSQANPKAALKLVAAGAQL